jgi:hypothetical protein
MSNTGNNQQGMDTPSGVNTTPDSDNGGAPVSISEQENLQGDGASDRYSNREEGELTGGDTDKFGVKQPDAMGAGG